MHGVCEKQWAGLGWGGQAAQEGQHVHVYDVRVGWGGPLRGVLLGMPCCACGYGGAGVRGS